MRWYDDEYSEGLVPNPYRAHRTVKAMEHHSRRRSHDRNTYEFGGVERFMVSCLILLAGTAVAFPLVAVTLDSWLAFVALEALLVLTPVGYLMYPPCYETYHSRMLALNELVVKAQSVSVKMGRYDLQKISENLLELPPSLRADLRPLWEASLTACEVLRYAPKDEGAIRALQERKTAVEEVVRDHRAILTEEKAQLDRAQARISRLELQVHTVSDLAVAEIYSEALREGRAKIKELGESIDAQTP